jgi:hypothetical protein
MNGSLRMGKIKNNQKGFTAVELLLVIIIIILMVFVCWFIYHTDHKTTPANVSKTPSRTMTTTPAVAAKYLEIPESGIRFKLSGAISDAYYVVNSDGFTYLSVHKFDNDGGLSGCSASSSGTGNLGVVGLVVAKPGEPGADEAGDPWTMQTIQQAGLQKVGDTYYGFQKGNGPCWNPTGSDANKEASQYGVVENAFMAAIPTITKL